MPFVLGLPSRSLRQLQQELMMLTRTGEVKPVTAIDHHLGLVGTQRVERLLPTTAKQF